MSSVLRVESLSKTYGHGDIFRDVSFTLGSGETLGLFGMSGSGKSTLGRCILGLERVSTGKIFYDEREFTTLSRADRSSLRPKMQMIFQHPEISFDPKKRLYYSVTEPRVYHEKQDAQEVFASLLPLIHAVGLHPEIFSKYPYQLSGGELQRAMLVRMYSLSPEMIIADEPTSMLDMSTQAQVLNLMKEFQRKNRTSCIFISHDPEVMQMICDRIGVLSAGSWAIMERETFSEMIQPMLVRNSSRC